MNRVVKLATTLPLVGAIGGCTSFITQQQGKAWPGHYKDCPNIYTATRMELSSLSWAFSDDSAPSDSCLRHYYPKAEKDSFYQNVNKAMIPFFILSLPADALLDTVTLPLADW